MREARDEILWPRTIDEASRIQEALSTEVRIRPVRTRVHFVAGADAAFSATRVFGAACLFSYPELEIVEESSAVEKIVFPYVPGYLAFREGPAILRALRNLKTRPDLVLVDGQGIAHPRRFGIASHLGVLLDLPTIGCAKSRLVGEYAEPCRKKGSWSSLLYEGKIVGAVLRTRDSVRPLFVSAGHGIDLEDSIEFVLSCLGGFRHPEPLRRADILSRTGRRRSASVLSRR
jgi:deoxyribonuclease V